jgi:hypothetical protein
MTLIVCYGAAMVALGYYLGVGDEAPSKTAENLAYRSLS